MDALPKQINADDDAKFVGVYTFTVVGPDGKVKRKVTVKNKVVDVGLTAIVNRIVATSPTNTLLSSHIAVGTGTNAPAAGNTQLQTETARKAITSRANSGPVGAISTAFNAGDIPVSTIREAAVFMEGSGTANSGTLLSRVAINIAITALDALFIDWRLTLSSTT